MSRRTNLGSRLHPNKKILNSPKYTACNNVFGVCTHELETTSRESVVFSTVVFPGVLPEQRAQEAVYGTVGDIVFLFIAHQRHFFNEIRTFVWTYLLSQYSE